MMESQGASGLLLLVISLKKTFQNATDNNLTHEATQDSKCCFPFLLLGRLFTLRGTDGRGSLLTPPELEIQLKDIVKRCQGIYRQKSE